MRGVLVGAVLIFALMLVIRDGRASRNLGLTGSCHAITAPAGDGGVWEACDPGKLEGAPDLSRQGCKSVKLVGKREYWRCPASIKSSHNTG
jgi:hypothetical protein